MTGRRPTAPPPLGHEPDVDSLIKDLTHGAHVIRSKRFRAATLWLAGILWTLGTSVAGWAAGKLDTRSEVAALSKDVQRLAGELVVLTSQQRDLVRSVNALSEPGGRLHQQSEELRFVWRQAVQTTSAVYAGESAATRERKREVAKEFGARFDRQIERRQPPAAAADVVLGQIAVP